MPEKRNISDEILHVDLKGFLPIICEVFVKLFGILLDKAPSINLTYDDDDCWQNRSYTCASGGQYILCARINFHLSIQISLKRARLKCLLSSWGAVLLLQHSKLGHRPALHPAPAQPHNGEMSALIVTVATHGEPVPGIAVDG